MKTLILSQEYIQENSMIAKNVPFEELRPLIFAIQDFKLVDVLGSKLMNEIMLQTSTDPNTLTTDNKILCDDYVLPFLNWHLAAARCISGKTVLYAAGTMENRTDNSDQATTNDALLLEKRFLSYAYSYQTNMIRFLNANLSLYPLYTSNTALGEVSPVKKTDNTGGLYLGDYYTPKY